MADRGGTLKESSASGRIRPSLGGPVAASDRAITRRGSYSRTDRSAFRPWIGPCPEQRAPSLVERFSHCKRVAFFRECDPHATVSGSPLG